VWVVLPSDIVPSTRVVDCLDVKGLPSDFSLPADNDDVTTMLVEMECLLGIEQLFSVGIL